jgi:hypothetical protein
MQKGGFVKNKCPKCGGNLYLDSDQYGWYEQCLQCSFTSIMDKIVDAKEIAKSKNSTGRAKVLARVTK